MKLFFATAVIALMLSSSAYADHYSHADTFEGKTIHGKSPNKAQHFEEQHFEVMGNTYGAYEGSAGSLGKKSDYHCCATKEPRGQGGGYFGAKGGDGASAGSE